MQEHRDALFELLVVELPDGRGLLPDSSPFTPSFGPQRPTRGMVPQAMWTVTEPE